MEPTEASNLDDQYKYYWEGDLCGHLGQEEDAVGGPALPSGRGHLENLRDQLPHPLLGLVLAESCVVLDV